MGGNAFNNVKSEDGQPIQIARLSHAVYKQLRDTCIEALLRYFDQVICPAEAPEKVDHGDVDLLVQSPKPDYNNADLEQSLDVRYSKVLADGFNFAIALNEDADAEYAQVDVHICSGNINWLSFMQSYGDLWQILGVVIRPHGFTATDRGFHVRLAGSEGRDRKASMIRLSEDPNEVIDFLSIRSEAYRAGFATQQELFDWICESRFFHKSAFALRESTANDRRRLSTRPMFNRFVNEIVPDLPDQEPRRKIEDRVLSLHEAIEYFHRQTEYEERCEELTIKSNEDRARKALFDELTIQGVVHEKANLIIRGIKRWVKMENGEPSLLPEARMDEASQTSLSELLDVDKGILNAQAQAWLARTWVEIKDRERGRVKEAKRKRSEQSDL